MEDEGERSTALQIFTGLLGLFQEALGTLGGEDFIVLVSSTVVNFENIFLAFYSFICPRSGLSYSFMVLLLLLASLNPSFHTTVFVALRLIGKIFSCPFSGGLRNEMKLEKSVV